ncbi:hypothetical protein [Actinoplanes subglobosus]|uniref:Knr4/Smi1-like domain-containing protein n=1 Tax=Actinoplanes subglobosus TaxID=1547892 RepID=A0ABV8J2W0_9ACTN
MTGAFDLHGELAAGVRDAAGAWRFVREFAQRFASPLVDGDGVAEQELAEAQARLALVLPAALRDGYTLTGRRNDLTRSQDELLSPHRLHLDDTREVLVFRWECQHCAEWGVPVAALSEPDPPVVFRAGTAGEPWQPYLDRVSTAWVEMTLSEWMLSGDRFTGSLELDDTALATLEKRFRRLPMPEYPLWTGGGPTRWFEGHGAIMRDDAATWLWVRAPSAAGIAAVQATLAGDWLIDDED